MPVSSAPALAELHDDDLVARARAREPAAFEALIQRYNRRLYRVARGVVGSDVEAEDVLQDAYVRAFSHLDQFRGEALFSTWLTRIVLNEALGRVRRRRNLVALSTLDHAKLGQAQLLMFPTSPALSDPEADAARSQLRRLIEPAIDALPEAFRAVFVMRDVEDMSVEETAAYLGVRPETVKTRLHRARRLLRAALDAQLGTTLKDAFPFEGARCVRVAALVIERLEKMESSGP
jgi:RNA polymerase sigma-70 factor (ECF subfamily)